LDSTNQSQPGICSKNPIAPFFTIGFQKPGICLRKIPLHHFLPLDSRNQESAQIPGFWNPMVKNGAMGFEQIPGFWNPIVKIGAMGFFSDYKSSSAGSISVPPNSHGSTREQIIPPEPA
jgi:hypothetical protein